MSPGPASARASARSCGAADDLPSGDAWTLLLFIRSGRGGPARWRAPVDNPHAFSRFLVPHAGVQTLALEQIGDLLQRLLAEILDLQHLALGLANQVTERPDVRVLERIHRPYGQLELVDRRLEQLLQPGAVAGLLATGGNHRRRVRPEVGEILEVR